jgi:alkanesulfonate monooxygenase SsuD/methylene tetrahydromethanopterin reductase-like flavin-dependent oxidoreductase (luciferase family)
LQAATVAITVRTVNIPTTLGPPVQLSLYVNLYGDDAPDMADVVEQARVAEAAGFTSVVLGERHLHAAGYHEILTSLTWLAAHTTTIHIGTAGIIAPLHHPVLLAEQLAHIDQLSDGRLDAGFVIGYRDDEFRLFGVERAHRGRLFEEFVGAITSLWTQDRTTIDGRFVTLKDAYLSTVPLQRPRPPIWNGCRVSSALERTAWMCDAWTTSFNELDADLPAKIAEYRSYPTGPTSLGKRVLVCREAMCASTAQEARAAIEDPLRDLYADYLGWKAGSADRGRYADDWAQIEARSLIGSPAQCRDRLAEYAAMGCDGAILRMQPVGVAQRDVLASIERFGELLR